MQFKEKQYGKIQDVKCEKIIEKCLRNGRIKKALCNSKEFSMLGKCVPATEDERASLNGSRLLKLECDSCKNTIWKLCENSPDGTTN